MGMHRALRSVVLWLCLSFLLVVISLKSGFGDFQTFPTSADIERFTISTITKRSDLEAGAVNVKHNNQKLAEIIHDSKKETNDSLDLKSLSKFVQSNIVTNETFPYDWKQIVKPTEPTHQALCTIVTTYFNVPSKFEPKRYNTWMRNLLSLQDAMVIFTSPDMVSTIQDFRIHATNRTVIVPMLLEHVPMATMFSKEFWEKQFQKDREKLRHQSYPLFWIWLTKSWFVTQSIQHNYFQSSIFVWSDIGTLRGRTFNGRVLVQHPELIPRHAMLQMAHAKNPVPQPLLYFDRKNRMYHSGSHAAAYADTWVTFYQYFMETIQGFVDRDLFFGDDQLVLQSTCRIHPTICAYVNSNEVPDNSYFGLRYVLHHGGNYTYWYLPPLTSQEKEQLQQNNIKPKSLL